ncbi:DoxX family protein [Amycolatopsis sp. NPDC049868]|uniref:DoxX family protein n=1 Tax=Amycolatopsis sp. NPDC049868 TaxID=3363934 RepID=UPI0037AF58B4
MTPIGCGLMLSERSFSFGGESMQAVIVTLTGLLALVFLAAGLQKVFQSRAIASNMRRLGASRGLTRLIGALEILGAIGIVAGIRYPVAAIAATIGFVLLLVGAIAFHARAGDYGRRTRRNDAFAPPVLLILTGVLGALLLSGA